jgi:hypothetical protein
MHDTCNCANTVARRVCVLRNASGKDLYGEEEWKRMAKEEQAWCDYFCGNHSRNLQFDAFGRLFEAYIKRHLGHGLEGDGIAFRDFLVDKFPDLVNRCVGRAELSKRYAAP